MWRRQNNVKYRPQVIIELELVMWDWDAGDDDVPQIIEMKELRKLFCH